MVECGSAFIVCGRSDRRQDDARKASWVMRELRQDDAVLLLRLFLPTAGWKVVIV